jgi:hypothetical protein
MQIIEIKSNFYNLMNCSLNNILKLIFINFFTDSIESVTLAYNKIKKIIKTTLSLMNFYYY